MNDLAFQIGLDINQALRDLDKLTTSIKTGLGGSVDKTQITGMAKSFTELSSAARTSFNEQKNALASLISSGKQGSAAYNELLGQIRKTASETKNLENAMSQVDKALDAKSIMSKFSGIGSTVLGVFGGGMLAGGVTGMFSSLGDIVSQGLTAENRLQDMKIAFKQAGVGMNELDGEMKKAAESTTYLSQRFGVSAGAVREVQKDAALLGGVFGEQNKRVTELAVGIEALTRGDISTTDVIKAFTKGGEEGAAGLGRLTMKFPALNDAIKGIKDPAEKSKAAMVFLRESFDTFSDSPTTAINRLKVTMSSVIGGIALNVFQLFKPFLDLLNSTLVPALLYLSKIIKSIFEYIKPLAPVISGIMAGFVALAVVIGISSINFGALAASIWATTAAMLANPIGLIIAGIIAVGVAVFMAYQKFEGFRKVVNLVWDGIVAGAKIMWSYISNYFMIGFDIIKNIIGTAVKVVSAVMKGDFSGAWDSLKSGALETGNIVKTRVTNVVKDTIAAINEVGKSQENVSNKVKDTAAHYKALVSRATDMKAEIENAGKAFDDAFNPIVNQAKFVRAMKYMSKEQFQLYISFLKDNEKQAAISARAMSDTSLHELDRAGKKMQGIYAKAEEAGEATDKIMGRTKGDKSQKQIIDLSKDFDAVKKYESDVNNLVLKYTNEQSISETDAKLKGLELLKKQTTENETLLGSERLKIVMEIEKKIAQIKLSQQLEDLKVQEATEIKSAEDRYNQSINPLKEKLTKEKNLTLEQKRKINDSITSSEADLNINLDIIAEQFRAKKKNAELVSNDEIEKLRIDNAKKTEDAISKERINAIQDISRRTLALEIQVAKTILDKKLTEVRGNYALEMSAYEDFLAAKSEAELKQAISSATQTQKYMLSAVTELQQTMVNIKPEDTNNDQVKKDLASNKQKYTDDTNELRRQLITQKISYEDFLTKKAELDKDYKKKSDEIKGKEISGWQIVAKAISESFKKMYEEQAKRSNEITISYLKESDALKQQRTITEDLRRTQGEYSAIYIASKTRLIELEEKHKETFENAVSSISQGAASLAISLIANGESASKIMIKTAFSALKQLVPIFIAEIFGQSIGQLGPIAGAIVGGALTAGLYGLVSVAEAAALGAEGGYMDGVKRLGKRGKTDTMVIGFNPRETIFDEQRTNRDRELFSWLHRNPTRPASEFYINQNGELIGELKKLREDFKTARLVEVHDRMRVDINDNRTVEVKKVPLWR